MKIKTLLFVGVLTLLLSLNIFSYPRDEGVLNKPSVSFANLKDGDKVKSPFKVVFELSGMLISPAGEYVEGSGHHHLLINQPFIAKGLTIPADSNHLHFGKGQKEIELNLTSGTYKLTLQFADGYHRSYGEELSKTIQIEVQ
ncbi:DUF4399 domain-containing protein [Candidatus Methylopumilus universalis]|uniref:DUF4399 domain-containing protein n=1 Tax=Candidatus Methylopumilus universalis TaxID=2588536 RepID=UPI0011243143|nr:DUF4399 domain-containing protein [Candidatus Methylopumilus universalis]QDC45942.1 DUF4399 domain-containing protein [Candidatus Methylopumilus universalis]QDC98842.1 DUF4399 domain-containing protein [Candidatus Methylopumilus universalis]